MCVKFKFFLAVFYLFFAVCFSQLEKRKAEVDFFQKALSYHYTNKDSAYHYYKKSIKKSQAEKEFGTTLNAYIYLLHVNMNFYDLFETKKNLEKIELFFKTNDLDSIPNITFYKDYFELDKAVYYYNIKNYPKAKKIFKKLHNRLQKKNEITKKDISLLTSTYSYIATLNTITRKFDLANNIYKENIYFINHFKDSLDDWQNRIYNTKKLMAKVAFEKKDFMYADTILKDVISFYKTKKSNPRFKNNIISSFLSLAENLFQQQKYQKVFETLFESKQYYTTENPFYREFELLYGDTYLGLQKYREALIHYNNALDFDKKRYQNKKHLDIVQEYFKIGNLYQHQNKINKALEFYQKALIQLDNSFNNTDFGENPNPETVFSKIMLISILKEKLSAFLKGYQIEQNISHIINAHNTSFDIIETFDILRPEFESKVDKSFLIENIYPVFQNMLEVSYLIYKKTKNDVYLNDAFYFMEKSKSILLLESVRNTQAVNFGNVPNKKIEKELQYRAKIDFLEKEIFKETNTNKLQDSLNNLRDEYYDYIKKLEVNYPKYYNLKYNQTVVTANELQNFLTNNTVTISYLAGHNKLYAILIGKNKKKFYKLNYNFKIKEDIKKLYQNSAKFNVQDTSVFQKSNLVYNSVLKPIIQDIKAKNIIFFNDDLLNYIPMDALVTSLKNINFVISKYTVSYDNSATLWMVHQRHKKSSDIKLLAFAPIFTNEAFRPLRYNIEEVNNIANYFKNTIFLKEKASLKNFNDNYEDYNLIHLATHSVANDIYPDYSYLAFSDSSREDNLLYVKDLYNYNLNTELVVLSACETGIGKLQKGEGMLSLSRAFNYAGANSLTTTLWKIEDKSTSEIISNFYKYLKKGKSKSESLRLSKLDYLTRYSEDTTMLHPYFWSGIILSGNTNAIISYNYYWYLIIIVVLILVIVYRKKSGKLFK
jgi:CHAT domain-containing protein